MSVSDKVLDAIQILTKSYIRKAGYDRTIQAQIVSCEDATIGKYRCRYQDAIIYAYSNNTDVTYTKGSSVYILVPGNDMTKEKTILGSTEKLGINYISQAEGDQAYNIIGNNCITSNQKLYLDTNNKNYKYTIYSQQSNNNIITIDIDALNRYIKQSSSLIVGATFKTSIPQDRQVRGHYGITYNLKFLDNTSNHEVIRSYTVDEDNMVNNPYRLLYDTRQYEIFDIDGANFISLESIEIFNKDFPKAESNITEEMLITGDIEISALELYGAVRMTQEEINGVAISFYTPQGTFFIDGSTSASYKTITAQVRIKGKLASTTQNIPFYWGIENVGISTQSEYYNKYLGRGWKCLNDKNIIEAATEEQEAIIEWIPSTDTYIVKFNQATAKNNKFKVAAVYDENVITKQINIENLTSTLDLTIESNDGTKFYYDVGHPTLTCKVNGEQLANYTYLWAYESNTGLFENLPQTTDLNTEYNAAVAALQELQTAIASGTKFANAEADNLNALQTAIKQYKFIQRVQGNKIYDVQINHITNFGTFKCSVYNEQGTYCGTCSIILTNSLQSEDLYSLVINNGAVTFQYNENGVAPNNRSLDIQQQIQALSFTVYDNLGNPIDNDVIVNDSNCQIRWAIPIKNTMLIDKQDSESSSGTDETETYRYYDNIINLVYDIAQRYNVNNSRNQIQLTVDYKGMSLTAETDFTFVKQGEPGTNGTEYIVKLVPNTRMSNPPLWPMITYTGNKYILNYGLNSFNNETEISTAQSYQFFKAQLWHNGDLVWEGFTSNDTALDNTTKPSGVNWTILANKYNATSSDESAFTIDANLKIRYKGDTLGTHFDTPYANIIKCSITWQDKIYYGTIPITTAWVSNDNYRVALKDYTGWRYAMYTTDGMTPQYDNANPFEFIINQKIENVWEDVSLINGNYQVTYIVQSIGNYKNTSATSTVTNANLIEILNSSVYRLNCAKNQWRARPASRYDGVCVNAAITCLYKQGNNVVGKINVPIHFLLNKYGLAHINEWDGNSVQIDNEGGFILSPQMGAGSKNANNEFTGVLMGQVREAGKSSANTGLFGYSSGDRTFFLNSENGSALFGKQGNGQIIVDPDSNLALLYSSNFWKNYRENGLPTSYITENENGQGLLIDLTTPSIRYGNGKFSVSNQGILHAEEANISGAITASSLSLGQGVSIAGTNITGVLKSSNYDSSGGTAGFSANLNTGQINAPSLEISITDAATSAATSAANSYTDTKISAIPGQIESKVSEEIGKFQIGGTNILRDTIAMTNTSIWWPIHGANAPKTGTYPDPNVSGSMRVTNGGSAATCGISQGNLRGLVIGEKYTISCWIRSSVAGLDISLRALYYDDQNSHTAIKKVATTTTDWQYVKLEGETLIGQPWQGQGVDTIYIGGYVYVDQLPANAWFEVCAMKLERGTKATAYSPHPDDYKDYVARNYSTIKQTASQISSAVTSVKSYTDTAIDNVQIGGTNLLRYTKTMSPRWVAASGTTISDGVATITGSSSNWNGLLVTPNYDAALYDGVTNYILSFEYKSTAAVSIWTTICASATPVGTQTSTRTKYLDLDLTTLPSTNGEWAKYAFPSRTISQSDLVNGSGDVVSGYLSIYNRTDNVTVQVRLWKWEKGTKATDWSPNPEDYKTYVAENYSTITQTSDQISTAVTSVKTYTDDVVDNIKIGGRNILLNTGTITSWTNIALNSSNYAVKDCYKTYLPVPSIFKVDDLVTVAFDWTTTATTGNFHVECGSVTPYTWGTVVFASGGRSATSNYVDVSSSKTSGHFIVTFKITSSQTGAAETLQWLRIRVDGAEWAGKTFTMSNAKAEIGNKATAWSPAPEDAETYTDNAIRSQATAAASQVSQLSDRITSTVTRIDNIQNNMIDSADVNALIAAGNFATQSSVSQTASNLQVSITQAQNTANAANSTAQLITTGVTVDANGVTVGKSNSAVKGVFTNNSLQFQSGGKAIAWLSANSEEGLGVDTIQIGKQNTANQRWIISTSSDGSHLSFTRHQ